MTIMAHFGILAVAMDMEILICANAMTGNWALLVYIIVFSIMTLYWSIMRLAMKIIAICS